MIFPISLQTLSPNRGRFCRIGRLPHEGDDFAANRHALNVPPDEGGLQGGKIEPFNDSPIQQFNE